MSRITLSDVRMEAMESIKMLREGKVDTKQAQEIRGLLNTIIDTAKVEVDFIKALPKQLTESMTGLELRSIAASIEDKDKELDFSLEDIKKKQNNYRPETPAPSKPHLHP